MHKEQISNPFPEINLVLSRDPFVYSNLTLFSVGEFLMNIILIFLIYLSVQKFSYAKIYNSWVVENIVRDKINTITFFFMARLE